MPLDLARSDQIATRIRAAARACWYNAFRAMSCPDLPDALYVEGWAVEEMWGLVFEHGWVETGPMIIDPTPGASAARTYFAGLRLTLAAVLGRIAATGVRRPPFIRTYDRTSREAAGYEQAYLHAWVFGQLRGVLAPLAACTDLECDGLTCCLHILLTAAGVGHTVYVGTCTADRQTIPLHWWVNLANGWRLDYRARRWLGDDPAVPHGLVRPADYPTVEYAGTPHPAGANPALFALLAPTVDLAALTAAIQAIPYQSRVLPAGESGIEPQAHRVPAAMRILTCLAHPVATNPEV